MQTHNYSYPIDADWTSQELSTVIKLFNCVEDAYEIGVNRQKLLDSYREFQKVINSKSYEKRLSREFEQVSGYSIYLTIKQAHSSASQQIRMIDGNEKHD